MAVPSEIPLMIAALSQANASPWRASTVEATTSFMVANDGAMKIPCSTSAAASSTGEVAASTSSGEASSMPP